MDGTGTNLSTTGGRARSTLAVIGACVACCVPMLIVLGAISVGTAVLGGVALGAAVAVGGVAWIVLRPRGSAEQEPGLEESQPGRPD
ncbi:MAG: hypothetical protein OSA99_20425 [Acidimicrobiales bacterium]|nr:hypothetical protein [Acidimicrobiales bacterium]